MNDFISHAIVSAMAHDAAKPDVVIVSEKEVSIASVYHPQVLVVRTSHEAGIILNKLLSMGAKVGVSCRDKFVVYYRDGGRVSKWTLKRPVNVRI